MTGCVQSQKIESPVIIPGIYQTNQYLPLLRGKNVAVVANKASIINKINIIDTLLNLQKQTDNSFKVKIIFSPEHGFSGNYDAGKVIESDNSKFEDITVISIYGKKRKPEKKDITQVDIVLFDLQDVGARFYTYISTLHYVMQACAENKVQLVVLDRPNPNAYFIDGPILESRYQSFVGMHPVPVVYGMTIGEYAKMINGEGWLGEGLKCDLTIIPIKNYTHHSRYDLPVRPSPNLPNMQAVYLYPSLCFFEGTVVSVGRGTDFPFQVVGHPEYSIKNFEFTPESRPGASLYPVLEDTTCYGLDLRNYPLDSLFKSGTIHLKFLLGMYHNLNQGKSFFNNYFDYLAGTSELRKQILSGMAEEEIRNTWKKGIDDFKKIRAKYLLSPE